MADLRLSGIGMTSARTRDRLVQRLREQGIANLAVLDRIRNVPRHIFVDEALGSRAYEDTALPIGFGQTISQPYIVARMTEALLEAGAELRERFAYSDSVYDVPLLASVPHRYAVNHDTALLAVATAPPWPVIHLHLPPGVHTLALADASGRALDTATFRVRGAEGIGLRGLGK